MSQELPNAISHRLDPFHTTDYQYTISR